MNSNLPSLRMQHTWGCNQPLVLTWRLHTKMPGECTAKCVEIAHQNAWRVHTWFRGQKNGNMGLLYFDKRPCYRAARATEHMLQT